MEANGELVSVPGWSKLTEKQQELFLRVYNAHLATMGPENKSNHSLQNIKKIEWNRNEVCLHVYYRSGEWWHYSNGTWY